MLSPPLFFLGIVCIIAIAFYRSALLFFGGATTSMDWPMHAASLPEAEKRWFNPDDSDELSCFDKNTQYVYQGNGNFIIYGGPQAGRTITADNVVKHLSPQQAHALYQSMSLWRDGQAYLRKIPNGET